MASAVASSAPAARNVLRAIGLALWLILATGAAHAEAPAALTEPVVDRTGTLAPGEIAALRAKIDAIASRKGSQVAVLMVETTEPLAIEPYALAVAEATRLGRAGVDDGVLIVVAKRDRAVRIEVGRGLEGAIPDAIASRIIREYLGPRFRAGDYAGGLGEAIDALGRLIDGEPLPAPLDAHAARDRSDVPEGLDFYLALFLGAFVAAFVAGFGLSRGVRVAVAGAVAALVAGAALKTLVAIVAAAIAAAVFSLFDGIGRGGIIGPRGRGRGGWGGGGSFGGGSGGGWSGGGWSGGGGSFGGGGASGRW
jgi:uncharacterized protein